MTAGGVPVPPGAPGNVIIFMRKIYMVPVTSFLLTLGFWGSIIDTVKEARAQYTVP